LLRIPPKTYVKTMVVADLRSGKLAEIPYKLTLQLPDSGAALSPDGCLLAQQTDWHLQVYDLCHAPFAKDLGLSPAPPTQP